MRETTPPSIGLGVPRCIGHDICVVLCVGWHVGKTQCAYATTSLIFLGGAYPYPSSSSWSRLNRRTSRVRFRPTTSAFSPWFSDTLKIKLADTTSPLPSLMCLPKHTVLWYSRTRQEMHAKLTPVQHCKGRRCPDCQAA